MCELESSPGPEPPPAAGSTDPAGAPPLLEDLVEPLPPVDVAPPLAPDTILTAPDGSEFRILRHLDTQGSAHLYEATRDGETVWIRQSLTDVASGRLRQEAEVLTSVASPMFPRVLAHFDHEGSACLVTEPLDAPKLADALRDRQLSLSQILPVVIETASALGQLHAHGWVHLGVRPEAIQLGRPIKLADFSFVTRAGERPPCPLYHPGYSPPELLSENPVDARADIYSVGALLFHAVDGNPIPETGPEILSWQPPTPVGGVPQILHRCLGSPETRYASMADLHRDLLRLARRLAPRVSYSVAAGTNIGLQPARTTNQDAYAHLTGQVETEAGPVAWAVACVADGIGGMAAGEVASEVAVKAVLAAAAADFAGQPAPSADEQVARVRRWVYTANEQVCAALGERQAVGGCTLVCACLVGRRLTIAHVGDCRIYHIRGDAVQVLTRDHSLAMAHALQGEIPMEAVRHHPDRSQVTRSLGQRPNQPDHFVDTLEQMTGSPVMELEPGDVLLLCSDGLWEPVEEDAMVRTVADSAPNLNAAVAALLGIALRAGAPDNATAVLVRVNETSAPQREG